MHFLLNLLATNASLSKILRTLYHFIFESYKIHVCWDAMHWSKEQNDFNWNAEAVDILNWRRRINIGHVSFFRNFFLWNKLQSLCPICLLWFQSVQYVSGGHVPHFFYFFRKSTSHSLHRFHSMLLSMPQCFKL